jgi:hypothetical protein
MHQDFGVQKGGSAGKSVVESFERKQASAFPATLSNKRGGGPWRDRNTSINNAVL